jgi:hypothetical protein
MYLGAMGGLAFQAMTGRRRGGLPSRAILGLLGVMAAAFAIDGLNSYAHFFPGAPSLYEPNNELRLLTGSGMGVAVSVLLFPAFNQTFWKDWDPKPALTGWRSLAGVLAAALLLDLAVLTENPLLLYPLALASAAGVLVLLSMVYGMIWLILFRAENRYLHFRQLLFPLAAGFGLALAQIALLDFIRYILTGTWGGFII